MKLHQKSWKFDQSSVIANFDYTKLIIHFTMGSVLHYNLAPLISFENRVQEFLSLGRSYIRRLSIQRDFLPARPNEN